MNWSLREVFSMSLLLLVPSESSKSLASMSRQMSLRSLYRTYRLASSGSCSRFTRGLYVQISATVASDDEITTSNEPSSKKTAKSCDRK